MYFDTIKINAPHTPSGSRTILASGCTDGSVVFYDTNAGEYLGLSAANFDSVGALSFI